MSIDSQPERGGAPTDAASAPAIPSSPELIARLYEHSLVPVREIARLAGITERNVYATVRRLGCRPRMRTAPGGGRRVALDYEGTPPAMLDEAAVAQAVAAWTAAAERQRADAHARVEIRKGKAAAWRRVRAREAEARVLTTVARAVRDLAAAGEAKKRKKAAAAQRGRTLDEKRRALAEKLENWVRGQEEKSLRAQPRASVLAPDGAPRNGRSSESVRLSRQPRIRGC